MYPLPGWLAPSSGSVLVGVSGEVGLPKDNLLGVAVPGVLQWIPVLLGATGGCEA